MQQTHLDVFTQMPHMLTADLTDRQLGKPPAAPNEAIFSRERLLKIRAYANLVTELPLEMYGALTALDEAYRELRLFAFLENAKTHGHNWRHIERMILETGAALHQFGRTVSADGREILRVISDMPVMRRMWTLNETRLSLGAEDEQARRQIRSLLSQLRQAAMPCKRKADDLYKDMSAFREKMDNLISPASQRICDAIRAIPPLVISARRGSRSYDRTLANCKFLENSPIGRGLIADLNNARDENAFLKAADKIDRLLVPMGVRIYDNFLRMQSVGTVIGDTVSGIQNLDTMLAGVIAYLEDAEKEVAAIQEADRLLIIQNHIRTVVESWDEIGNLSTALSDILTNPTQH